MNRVGHIRLIETTNVGSQSFFVERTVCPLGSEDGKDGLKCAATLTSWVLEDNLGQHSRSVFFEICPMISLGPHYVSGWKKKEKEREWYCSSVDISLICPKGLLVQKSWPPTAQDVSQVSRTIGWGFEANVGGGGSGPSGSAGFSLHSARTEMMSLKDVETLNLTDTCSGHVQFRFRPPAGGFIENGIGVRFRTPCPASVSTFQPAVYLQCVTPNSLLKEKTKVRLILKTILESVKGDIGAPNRSTRVYKVMVDIDIDLKSQKADGPTQCSGVDVSAGGGEAQGGEDLELKLPTAEALKLMTEWESRYNESRMEELKELVQETPASK